MTAPLHRFRAVMHRMFQFDLAELDFGIYRILNQKRRQIDSYLNERLPQIIQSAFAHYSTRDRDDLQKQSVSFRKQIIDSVGIVAFDDTGMLKPAYQGGAIGQLYLTVQENLARVKVSDQQQQSVYNDLAEFFERYYHDGDYVSRRRRSRNETYALPYDGREVVLYWANQDQYYIKTGEHFRGYRFTAGTDTVRFTVQQASTTQNSNKGTRFFLLAQQDAVQWDETSRTLTIVFVYRLLTTTEQQHYNKGTPQRIQETINHEIAVSILDQVSDSVLKLHLAQIREGQQQSTLLKHLTRFTRRNMMDFFIHQNLAEFLNRELDFYIKNEVLRLDDLISGTEQTAQNHIHRARVVRDIGRDIIAFLAQIEQFQKKLFKKKKFVTRTEYCITVDRVPVALWQTILANDAQVDEWRNLFALDTVMERDGLFNTGIDENLLHKHPTLVVDTRHFDQAFKDALLSSFDDLDDAIDGIVIKSENFQALNLLMNRYREQIKTIYIDPPYNTDASEILYMNGYKHASWLTLMNNRLQLAKSLLQHDGILCVTIDDVEFHRLYGLLVNWSGDEDTLLGTVPIRSNPAGRSTLRGFSIAHEYAIFVAKSDQASVGRLSRSEQQIARYKETDKLGAFEWVNFRKHGGENANRTARPRLFYPIYASVSGTVRIPEMTWDQGIYAWQVLEQPQTEETVVYPFNRRDEEKTWKWSHTAVRSKPADFCTRSDSEGKPGVYMKSRLKQGGLLPVTWWDKKEYSATEYGTNLLGRILGTTTAFSFPKSVHAIEDCLRAADLQDDDICLDFFAGSGTTGHAVINLNRADGGNRKYILVEMGEYFDTILLPRLKKVIFSDTWKDGKPVNTPEGGHFLQYVTLEQYEDTLNNLELPRQQEGQQMLDLAGDNYMLNYMLDFETQGSQSLLTMEAFQTPFDYTLIVNNGLEGKTVPVDLVTTFAYLLGLHVRQQRAFDHAGRRYVALWGRSGNDDIVIIWRNLAGIIDSDEGFIADRDFICTTVVPSFLGEQFPHRLLVNGMAMVERDGVRAESLDGVFHSLMFTES